MESYQLIMEQETLGKVILGPKGQPSQNPMTRVQHASCLICVFSSSKKMVVIVNYIQSLYKRKYIELTQISNIYSWNINRTNIIVL